MPCCSYWLFLELLFSTLKSTGGAKARASEEVGPGEGNQGLADLVVCCTFLRVSMVKMTYLHGMKRFTISDQTQALGSTSIASWKIQIFSGEHHELSSKLGGTGASF